jgi:hypothetical protein
MKCEIVPNFIKGKAPHPQGGNKGRNEKKEDECPSNHEHLMCSYMGGNKLTN